MEIFDVKKIFVICEFIFIFGGKILGICGGVMGCELELFMEF